MIVEASDDIPYQELDCYLRQVEADLTSLTDTGFSMDPDTLVAKLDLDALLIQETVDSLLAQAELSKLSLVHVNDVINHACKEFLMTQPEPLVIRTSLSCEIPELPRDQVREFAAATIRTLQLAADVLPSGAEVAITSSSDEGQAIIRIRSECDQSQHRVPLEVRTCTLQSMIRDLGGHFEIERHHDAIEMALHLPTVGAPQRSDP